LKLSKPLPNTTNFIDSKDQLRERFLSDVARTAPEGLSSLSISEDRNKSAEKLQTKNRESDKFHSSDYL
jgi:hypothetical protein